MPRSKTVDGKRVAWTVRLSEPEAAAAQAVIDASGWKRSEWLRHLVAVAVTPPAGAQAKTKPESRKDSHRCPAKGWCGDCEEWKGSKK
jgi:hypothetical protein